MASVAQLAPDTRNVPAGAKTLAQVRQPYPTLNQPWENKLGMKFAPVPGTGVLFCIWETRVQDFETFVKDTGYDATGDMYSLGSDGWKERGNTWRSPGFSQGPTHPVCGVSWDDAKAFCRWLTEKERREDRLGSNQEYRLPTDAEWSVAVGLDETAGSTPQSKDQQIKGVYPWGTQWPPPRGAGNFAGTEARDGNWPSNWSMIEGYNDGYPRTAPVGSFTANRYGLYDLSGNVWEWCEDYYDGHSGGRVLRGGAFDDRVSAYLLSSYRVIGSRGSRRGYDGFRCVMVVSALLEKQTYPALDEPRVVASPDEYVVKPGDTGTKIAKAVGVSIVDIEAANPDLDWRRLRVGQKIKVPSASLENQRVPVVEIIRNNLRQLAAAANQYYLENGVSEVRYDQLVGPDKYIKRIDNVAGEDYTKIQFKQDQPLRVRTANGYEISNEQ